MLPMQSEELRKAATSACEMNNHENMRLQCTQYTEYTYFALPPHADLGTAPVPCCPLGLVPRKSFRGGSTPPPSPQAWIGHHGPEKSYRPLLNEAKALIAAEIHAASPDDVVLVENASTLIDESYPWAADLRARWVLFDNSLTELSLALKIKVN